jgi:hypothetical protein
MPDIQQNTSAAANACHELDVAEGLQPDEWRTAGRCMLINNAVFFVLSVSVYALAPKSLGMILLAPAVFFFGSLLTFALMIRSGAALAPIAWFTLGAGIYFGLGGIAGGLRVHPHSELVFGTDILYLTRVNLLNACSVLIVTSIALLVSDRKQAGMPEFAAFASKQKDMVQRCFPYLIAVAAIGVCFKYIFFLTLKVCCCGVSLERSTCSFLQASYC